MIDKALKILRDELIEYVSLQLKSTPDSIQIALSSQVDDKGAVAFPQNSLGMTLVNVEEERVLGSPGPTIRKTEAEVAYLNPEVKINLYILFAANFGDYGEALKWLSLVITFFQSRSVFDTRNTPKLDPGLDRLVLELRTQSFEEQNYLWGMLGAKYLPSVLYRLRMVTLKDNQTYLTGGPVETVEIRNAMEDD